ncbi:aminotransferase class IV family protein [Aliarcobacter cryaerophilus]|uniref:Branched-chain amino acid aminotransferase n=1 Tax=Aliarcobacter cryaerophilus TaxID=28198 RepID=A0A2S9TJD1_9BACT|nr:aminotransferase class IV family protein [Aliarcobacter cryaerophilus]PRM98960.1 branched-chain amino acid aminotransferase [Arcobacter cryaerophilus gv. crypticus]
MFFETIKCDDFEIFNLEYHQKRVARTIGKNFDLREYINPPTNKLLRCKIVYNKDEILSVDYFTYQIRDIKSFKILFDDSLDYSKKYLNRDKLDELFFKKDTCDEIIIVKNEIVTDTSIANIAIFYDGVWITSKNCLLEGTCRAKLIEKKEIFEKDISLDMLKNASKIALMNAMIDFYEIKDFKIED